MTMTYEVGSRVRNLGNLRTGEVVEARHRRGLEPTYVVDFGDGEERLVKEHDVEGVEVDLRGPEHKENDYRRHLAGEDWSEGYGHPDGCYWCGSPTHPSDGCSEREEFYEE